MVSYDDLPDIKKKMYLSAIDCWMSETDYPVHFRHDNRYALWGVVYANSYQRPDPSSGEGGGEFTGWVEANHPSRAGSFDTIRASVDDAFRPWEGLPDGSSCDSARDASAGAAAAFGTSAAGTTVLPSAILNSKDTVKEVTLNKISGAFTSPFLAKYDEGFANVIGGTGAACGVLQTVYTAQSAMWKPVRRDVAEIMANAQSAFALAADRERDAWLSAVSTVALTFVGAVVGVFASIVTAGAAAPAVAALAGTAAAATTAVDAVSASATVSGSSYQEIWGSFFDALGKLNQSIYDVEYQMYTMLVKAQNAFAQEPTSFNLDKLSLGLFPGADGIMTMDRNDTNHVSRNMGTIADALATAKSTLSMVPSTYAVQRHESIGMGATGPMVSAVDVHNAVINDLNATAKEYARGQDLFDAVVEDFFSSDAAATTTVNALIADEALTGNN